MSLSYVNLNEKEEQLFGAYSAKTSKSLSELFRTALLDQIEDELDYEIGINSLIDFEKNSTCYSIDCLISELENDI